MYCPPIQKLYFGLAGQLEKIIRGLADGYQFDFKYEGGAARYSRLAYFAVSLFEGYVYLPFIAHFHLLKGYYPARYQVAQTECRSHASSAAVESLAIDSAPGVMYGYHAVAVGRGAVSAFQYFVIYAFVERLHARLGRFFGEPPAILVDIFLFCHIC